MRGRERAPPPSRTANDNTLWPIPPPISPAASGRAAAVGQGAIGARQGATKAVRGRGAFPVASPPLSGEKPKTGQRQAERKNPPPTAAAIPMLRLTAHTQRPVNSRLDTPAAEA